MNNLLRYSAVEMENREFKRVCYSLVAEKFENKSWKTVAVVEDVSCSKKFVTALANRCTAGQLDPIHILDVVLDAIC